MGAITSVAIRTPTDDPKNHTTVLRQLKEASETASRQRGSPNDSYAQVAELVATGVFRLSGNALALVQQSSGWGAPVGAGVLNNFDATTATTAQTAEVVAQLIAILLKMGIITS